MTFDPSDIVTGIVALLGGGGVASVVAGAIAFFVGRAFGKKPAPARSDTRLQRLAFRAEAKGKKQHASLLQAISNNDRQALANCVDRELLVHETVPELLSSEVDRGELLALIGQCEGIDDLAAVIDEAKVKRASLPTAVVAPLLALALCLFMGSTAAAGGWAPERWEPTVETPVIDGPTFATRASSTPRAGSQIEQIYAELGRPQGGGHYHFESQGACSGRTGFWQRGKLRRGLAFAGRFILRPFRWR